MNRKEFENKLSGQVDEKRTGGCKKRCDAFKKNLVLILRAASNKLKTNLANRCR
jgi:hypothetical protein